MGSSKFEGLMNFAKDLVLKARKENQQLVLDGYIGLDDGISLRAIKGKRDDGRHIETKILSLRVGDLIHFDTKVEDIALKYLRECFPEHFDVRGNFIENKHPGFDSEAAVEDEVRRFNPTKN